MSFPLGLSRTQRLSVNVHQPVIQHGHQTTDAFESSPLRPMPSRHVPIMAQNDLSALDPRLQSALKKLKTNEIAIRDMPHDENSIRRAANYAFLSHFRDAGPEQGQAILARLSKDTSPETEAYTQFLRTFGSKNDDELLVELSKKPTEKVILDFSKQFESLEEFAHAVGIKFKVHGQPSAGPQDAPEASKTLALMRSPHNFVEPLHCAVLESPISAAEQAKHIQNARASWHATIEQLHQDVKNLTGVHSEFDNVQELHMSLEKAKRTAHTEEEKQKVHAALQDLHRHPVSKKAIVHFQDLLEGILAYSQHLDNNIQISQQELLQKKKLMEFNIEQLTADLKQNTDANRKPLLELYEKIVARLDRAKPKLNRVTTVPVSSKAPSSVPFVPAVSPVKVPSDNILDFFASVTPRYQPPENPIPLKVAEFRQVPLPKERSRVDNFFTALEQTGHGYEAKKLAIWRYLSHDDLAEILEAVDSDPERLKQVLKALDSSQRTALLAHYETINLRNQSTSEGRKVTRVAEIIAKLKKDI